MRFLRFILLFISSVASAQVTDSFSDGNFTSAPAWSGDAAEFIVNATPELQLNNTVGGASYLSTASPGSSIDNTQWNFYIKQTFSPSGSNYGRVYLVSDQANLEGPLNGYYLQFGEALSLDAVELFRQTGGTSTSVCRGTDGAISASFAIGVKVTRDAAGNWSLYVDPAGGTAYNLEDTGTDLTHTTTSFFGVACVYTVSSATKFFFDNFYNGAIIVDLTAPTIVSSTVISNTQLDVLFSESVDLATSQTITNYSADNGLGNPATAARDGSNLALVHLTFATAFTDGLLNTLTVTNVQDLSANAITTANTTFTYIAPVVAAYRDIIINEIMADPSPVIGMPAVEFIEIHNRSASSFDMNGWEFSSGTSTATIGNFILAPGQYLILCDDADTALFTGVNKLGLTTMPGLTNSGSNLKLRDNTSLVIDSLTYALSWYQDGVKEDGGWTLELINPGFPIGCPPAANWIASNDPDGGTPGTINSVYSIAADTIPPLLNSVLVISVDTIQLYFNEPLNSVTMQMTTAYNIDNGIGTPVAAILYGADFMSIKLVLGTPLSAGVIYTVTVSPFLTDCIGNSIVADNSEIFAVPEAAQTNDIVINEIMYDARTNGVDWVEIYNRSNKVIDLKTITISEYDTVLNVISGPEIITTEGYLFFPGKYLVLSTDENAIKAQYMTTDPQAFLDIPDMPAMNIDGGTVCLSTSTTIIDNFTYYEEMQFPLLDVTKGVSLERIDFERATNDFTNWHSASFQVGYATPGYKNSQYNDAGETGNEIEITPEVFSPDEDGTNDVVNINYNFDTPGFLANVTIYDSKGRMVKRLIQNELLGINGTFSWDGIDEEREKARIGIYIFYIEVFDLSGTLKKFKKTCVLASKL